MSIQTIDSEPPVLHDYKLEEWLRQTYGGQKPASPSSQPTWKQRVLYAIGHAINAYYSLSPDMREVSNIGKLVDFRWPRRPIGFESEAHYWEVKDTVIAHLGTLLAEHQHSPHPVMLYEQQKVIVPELGAELSLIFQAAWQTPWATAQPDVVPFGHKSLIVQKFFWEHEPHLEEAFIHLSTVFCQTAFGSMPERIEIFNISAGTVSHHIPSAEQYGRSIDYLELLRHAVPGGPTICTHCRSNAGTAYLAPKWSLT